MAYLEAVAPSYDGLVPPSTAAATYHHHVNPFAYSTIGGGGGYDSAFYHPQVDTLGDAREWRAVGPTSWSASSSTALPTVIATDTSKLIGIQPAPAALPTAWLSSHTPIAPIPSYPMGTSMSGSFSALQLIPKQEPSSSRPQSTLVRPQHSFAPAIEKRSRRIKLESRAPPSKPFACTQCGKSFSQAANLTAHRRVHTGEKPFECPVCHRPFSQSSSLVTHKRTHSGERPYNCPHCEKCFTDSSTLTKHLRTHTGQKPYACNMCMMRFTQSGNLHRHMKTHKGTGSHHTPH